MVRVQLSQSSLSLDLNPLDMTDRIARYLLSYPPELLYQASLGHLAPSFRNATHPREPTNQYHIGLRPGTTSTA
jgi:hypothetical protein